MTKAAERLLSFCHENGWEGRIVSMKHLIELEQAIRSRYELGLIDETLYREQLGFAFRPPAELETARSLLVVAVPVPQTRIAFHWKGIRRPVVVPPTYVGYSATTARVQAILGNQLEQEGYRAAKTWLPLKTLAVHSGLADYGRNNICYVKGMGSFLQLVGVFSDLPCVEDPWRNATVLDRCASCTACLNSCPTGAISRDRFLLQTELCLTYHNEAAAEFPSWIDPSWHHCLVGCMRCQNVCPENKAVLRWFDDRAEFYEWETALLAKYVPFDLLPGDTAAKLKSLQINEDYRLLCRNLSMILEKAEAEIEKPAL